MKKRYLGMIILGVGLLGACGAKDKNQQVPPVVEEEVDQAEVLEKVSWFKDMKTQDLDGNEIDASMFAEYDLSLVNIWASWCPPCIMEIPELDKVANQYTNVGVKGLIVEHEGYNIRPGLSQGERQAVEEILDQTGATYQHILVWDDLLNTSFTQVESFPETVFVDSEGNFVGPIIRGARTQEEWGEIIEERLEMIK